MMLAPLPTEMVPAVAERLPSPDACSVPSMRIMRALSSAEFTNAKMCVSPTSIRSGAVEMRWLPMPPMSNTTLREFPNGMWVE